MRSGPLCTACTARSYGGGGFPLPDGGASEAALPGVVFPDVALPDVVLLKVGTMDNPALFTPDLAIFTCDAQSFHHVPAGMPAFERMPG